jgi:tetratricopeptide (TPR) repeat protein
MNSIWASTLLLWSFTLVLSASHVRAQDSSYEQLIAKANDQAQRGDLLPCVSTAQSAISVAPSQFQGYYYAGYCLFKQNVLQQALGYARKSLELAPPDRKPEVEKLVSAISGEIGFTEQKGVGDQALQQGLRSKAATAYAAAWRASPAHEDIGMKAAETFIALNMPLEAADVLNEIVAHPKDSANLPKAKQMLATLQQALAEVWGQSIGAASKLLSNQTLSDDEKEEILRLEHKAMKALPRATGPGPNNPYLTAAAIYASRGDMEDVRRVLGQAANLGMTLNDPSAFTGNFDPGDSSMNQPIRAVLWQPVLCKPDFLQFLGDAFGERGRQTAVEVCQQHEKAAMERQKSAMETQKAQEQLLTILSRISKLLNANFDDAEVKLRRHVTTTNGCTIAFQEDTKWVRASSDREHVTIPLAGLTASHSPEGPMFLEFRYADGQQHIEEIQGDIRNPQKQNRGFPTRWDFRGLTGSPEELINLLNDASLACTPL